MIYPWGTKRRFNAYVNYLRQKFGHRIQKVAVDAGFTCPNRDGSVGFGGCTYCNNDAFNPSYCNASVSISKQIEEGIKFQKIRYKNAVSFFAYFQAYSNTYDKLENLKSIYHEALSFKEITGLVIGTRPDAVDAEKLDYLAELAEDYYISVEYGIESCYDRTLKRINRGHDFNTTANAIRETANRGLPVGGHLIFGLPGESKKQMLDEAAVLSELPITTLKLHQLQLFRNTTMGKEYLLNPDDFLLFDYDEYKDFVIDFLELLSPEIKIERLAGEAPPKYILGGQWDIRNDQILDGIEHRMEERNTWQGKKFRLPAN
ncbi:MAG: TIGR01212 family radical SAM protein [Bacteroidales bacterium]|nr:TIGR01212 family radical SAM protein [Bacteroidales bacterium]